jgi:hypothetical protein
VFGQAVVAEVIYVHRRGVVRIRRADQSRNGSHICTLKSSISHESDARVIVPSRIVNVKSPVYAFRLHVPWMHERTSALRHGQDPILLARRMTVDPR